MTMDLVAAAAVKGATASVLATRFPFGAFLEKRLGCFFLASRGHQYHDAQHHQRN